MASCEKYNIKVLQQCFIAAYLLKSRFGTSNIMVPYGFYGDVSHFFELPRVDEIGDFEIYTDPNWVNKPAVDNSSNTISFNL